MKNQRHLGIQAEQELLDKLYYIAKYNGRSGSGQVIYMVRALVNDFEREHGKITEQDLKDIGIIK
ncbi:MAG: hypothetical protein IJ391_02120 [Clostridia bacterium]|nr:hypothetical protein [Clostridia bacterium]